MSEERDVLPNHKFKDLWTRRHDTEVPPSKPWQPNVTMSEKRAVPPIGKFRDLWTRRHDMEVHLGEPLPSSIRLILGVMTVAQHQKYRQVVRQTWLKQASTCYWGPPQENCSVYVAFVVGKNGTGSSNVTLSAKELAKAHREKGMLVLDTVENMNDGKSFLWFATALEMFPWATHIGKMDIDTYPFLHKLLYRLNFNHDCVGQISPYEFIGRPALCQGSACPFFTNLCPSSGCVKQYTSGVDMKFQFGGPFIAPLGVQWNFITGELYILSFPLVQRIPWKLRMTDENEDVAVSKTVNSTAGEQHFCVVSRRLDAWYHMTDASDADYANNFET